MSARLIASGRHSRSSLPPPLDKLINFDADVVDRFLGSSARVLHRFDVALHRRDVQFHVGYVPLYAFEFSALRRCSRPLCDAPRGSCGGEHETANREPVVFNHEVWSIVHAVLCHMSTTRYGGMLLCAPPLPAL